MGVWYLTKKVFKVSLKDVYIYANDVESAIAKFSNYANISADMDSFEVIEVNNPDKGEREMAVDML